MAWRFLDIHTTDPTFNLALEQYVFDCLPREDNYFMLWQNASAIIIGRHQNAHAEINLPYVREHGVSVVRRLSGGGAVYHDLGNLNFTFIQDAQSTRLDLSLFCTPVAQALQSLGANAEVNGRNDITLDGKKISGNAQYVREGRIMHHGTLLFDADLEAASLALQPDAEKIKAKGVASVRSRMTTLKEHMREGASLADFKNAFLHCLFEGQQMQPYHLTDADIAAVEELRKQRYATYDWNFGQSPPCDLAYKGRVEGCGSLELRFKVKNGLICEATCMGDFFSEQDPQGLCAHFVGKTPDAQGFAAALETVESSQFIRNLTRQNLLTLLLETNC